ncbi:MAG: ZIP family metal transporter [Pseudobdellovibrio sp.]
MTTLLMATVGGLISLLSTSLGAFLPHFGSQTARSKHWRLSIDFALGLMIAASTLTLITPAIKSVQESRQTMTLVALMAFLGILFVYGFKEIIDQFQLKMNSPSLNMNSSQFILAAVLMLHNYPEGLASGAAMAGLEFKQALSILGGISIQNIPEGALMVLCLKSMGWSNRNALIGGVGSGVVELLGGISAGLLLDMTHQSLPYLLSFAGGCMMASVFIEMTDGEKSTLKRLFSKEFMSGFAVLALIQFAF